MGVAEDGPGEGLVGLLIDKSNGEVVLDPEQRVVMINLQFEHKLIIQKIRLLIKLIIQLLYFHTNANTIRHHP